MHSSESKLMGTRRLSKLSALSIVSASARAGLNLAHTELIVRKRQLLLILALGIRARELIGTHGFGFSWAPHLFIAASAAGRSREASISRDECSSSRLGREDTFGSFVLRSAHGGVP